MPIYEYRCAECGRSFELLVRSGTEIACPACHSRTVERLMSLTARSRGRAASADYSGLGPPQGGCCSGGGGCGCH